MNKNKSKMKKVKDEHIINRLAVRVSARFDYIIFPLDVRDFGRLLMSMKYTPAGNLPPEMASGGPGGQLTGTGAIAQKGNIIVDINTDRQFFGVTGPDPNTTFQEFIGIINKLNETRLLETENLVFYETQARYRIISNDNFLEAFKHMGQDIPILNESSDIFKMPVSLYTLRFISSGTLPNSPDHLEIWMKPSHVYPERELGISVVYRNHELDNFTDFISTYENNLSKLLDRMLSFKKSKNKTIKKSVKASKKRTKAKGK